MSDLPRLRRDSSGSTSVKILGVVIAAGMFALAIGGLVYRAGSQSVSRDEYDRREEKNEDKLDLIRVRIGNVEGVQREQAASLKSVAESQGEMNRKLDKALDERRRRER